MKLKNLAAAAVALLIPLSACSSSPSDPGTSASPSASSSPSPSGSPSAHAEPVVDRDPKGELPTITFGSDGMPTMQKIDAKPPTEITVKTLKKGDGTTVESGAYVKVNYAGFLWANGTEFDSSFKSGKPAGFSLGGVVDGWRYGLVGTKVGDRVQIVVPPEYGYGDKDNNSIPGGSTLVFVVDILETTPMTTDALKTSTPTGTALPTGLTVSGEPGAQPTISYADGSAAPTKQEVVVLAEGKGAEITSKDTVFYLITAGPWGEKATSSWPDSFQQVPQGGGEVTTGKKVGSRILLVHPADASSGTPAQVYVIDVVAAIAAE